MTELLTQTNTRPTPYLSKKYENLVKDWVDETKWDINKNRIVEEEAYGYPGCFHRYGVEDGKIVAQAFQDDLWKVVDYCKNFRDMHYTGAKKTPGKGAWSMSKWAMPWIVEQELLARGWPLVEMLKKRDHSDLDRYFEYEAPEFKLTPATLTTLPRLTLFT